MRELEFITGHVIYNSAYTYKFHLKNTKKVSSTAWWAQTLTENKENNFECYSSC